jgi:hypothetical protein
MEFVMIGSTFRAALLSSRGNLVTPLSDWLIQYSNGRTHLWSARPQKFQRSEQSHGPDSDRISPSSGSRLKINTAKLSNHDPKRPGTGKVKE